MPESRICSECGQEKPLTREHFYPQAKASGRFLFKGQCIDCYNRLARERSAARREVERERWRWDARMRRLRDPERMRDHVRRYREKVKADEKLIEQRREAARIRYRLRVERAEQDEGAAMSTTRAHPAKFPNVPAGPLAAAVDAWALRAGVPTIRCGVPERVLRQWREGKTAQFDTADRALIVVGLLWWEVWTPENTEPEALARVRFAFTGEGELPQAHPPKRAPTYAQDREAHLANVREAVAV